MWRLTRPDAEEVLNDNRSIGCTMRCIRCQNWSISRWAEQAEHFTLECLASAVEVLRRMGCRNMNTVGGEPTPNLWFWLRTMSLIRSELPDSLERQLLLQLRD